MSRFVAVCYRPVYELDRTPKTRDTFPGPVGFPIRFRAAARSYAACAGVLAQNCRSITKLAQIAANALTSGTGWHNGGIIMKVIASTALMCASCFLSIMPNVSYGAPITDGFEGSSLSPFWTLKTIENGTIGLSSAKSHSGSQALAFTSVPGGNRNLWLEHDFGQKMRGSVSVWFYDGYSGQDTLYSHLRFDDETLPYGNPGSLSFIGVQDWDGIFYHASVLFLNPDPTEGITTSARSNGWHKFEAAFGSMSTNLYIDGVEVYASPGEYGFTKIQLNLFGPSWRPDAQYFFDDFSANVSPFASPVPEPAGIYLLMTGLIGVAAFSRRRNRT